MGKSSKQVRIISGRFKGRKLFVNDPNIIVDGGITLRMHENDDTGAG